MNPALIIEIHVEATIGGGFAFEAVSLGGAVVSRALKLLTPEIAAQALREAQAQLVQHYIANADTRGH